VGGGAAGVVVCLAIAGPLYSRKGAAVVLAGSFWSGGGRPIHRRFTGQRWEASLGLYDYRARFYDPALGRFLQPDPLVPEPGNPQALNRYAYVYHNPLRYIDGDGHLPVVPLLVAGAILALKVVDYGWTAYEAWHSLRVMNDPHASPEARAEAAANLALTAAFEAGEPEELLPISLPLDDLARVGLIGGVKRVGKEAGEEAAERAGKEVAGESTQRLIRHHIATNKNWIRDPQWSKKVPRVVCTRWDDPGGCGEYYGAAS